MRIAVPLSLQIVTLVHADDDSVVTTGPFSSLSAMDHELTGRTYPDGGEGFKLIARYDPGQKRWVSAAGKPLIVWTVMSVDEADHRGHKIEKGKAVWVKREFLPEEADTVKED